MAELSVCSSKSRYEWLAVLEQTGVVHTSRRRQRRKVKREQLNTYRLANKMPLRDVDDTLEDNCC